MNLKYCNSYGSITVIFLLFFFVSCNTALYNGNKYYENGLYEDAELSYTQALEKEPNNTDAKIGLSKSRVEYSNQKIVAIRLMRLSGQTDKSLSMLQDFLHEKWNKWKLNNVSSALLTSLQDEVVYHQSYVENKINKLLEKELVLKAEDLLNENDSIFSLNNYIDKKQEIFNLINRKGKNKCNKIYLMLTNLSINFYKTTELFCLYYGEKKDYSFISNMNDYRFNGVEIKGEIKLPNKDVLKDELTQKLKQYLNDSLQKSNLYNSSLRNSLLINYKGSIYYNTESHTENFSHSYKEKMPYEAIENYMDTEYYTDQTTQLEQVPYQNCYFDYYRNQNICNTQYRLESKSVPVSRVRYVPKTRLVTKYKDVSRAYYYQGIKHNEKVVFSVVLKNLSFNEKLVQIALNDSKENVFITHNENLPDIGLIPKSEAYLNLVNYVDEKFKLASEEFFMEFGKFYISKFCNSKNKDIKINIEYTNRCGDFDKNNNIFVQFYNNEFGYTKLDLIERLTKK